MKRLANVLFWSVISAAFLGPGTVTTAASAGASHRFALAWALVFSTVACIVLQEAVARLVIASGEGLGPAIRAQAGGGRFGRALAVLVGASIILGCAAYEAGNILGGVAGLGLLAPETSVWTQRGITLACGLVAGAILWSGNARRIAQALGLLVALMGVAFVVTALRVGPSFTELLRGSVAFGLPEGSSLLALGLVGTTVVPYNLFLGAGLARGQPVAEMRTGLVVAIALGGVISLAVMAVGSTLEGSMSFAALAEALRSRLGPGGDDLFAWGLFAAGFSSAITAPLAAAYTARSLSTDPEHPRWGDASVRWRSVWVAVLAVGVTFGVSGVKPIPVIVLAQALNGVVLPLAAVLVLLAVNDRARMGRAHLNGALANALGLVCVAVTIALGLNGLGRAVLPLLGHDDPRPEAVLRITAVVVLVVVAGLARARRRASTDATS